MFEAIVEHLRGVFEECYISPVIYDTPRYVTMSRNAGDDAHILIADHGSKLILIVGYIPKTEAERNIKRVVRIDLSDPNSINTIESIIKEAINNGAMRWTLNHGSLYHLRELISVFDV